MKKIVSALLILMMLLSMVCVSASADAGIVLSVDFSTATEDQFYQQFMPGKFAVDEAEGVLYGYYEAKALQSMYSDPEGLFDNTLNTWLTYDASVTVAMADDDMVEDDRYVCLAYCNDNRRAKGLVEKREFVTLSYDVQNEQFNLTVGDGPTYDSEGILMDPIPMALDTEGEEYYTIGISVDKNRIRFFVDDQLLYDYDGTDMLIAEAYNSPFMFWNAGNYIKIKNITVSTQGFLYPYAVDTSTTDTSSPEPSGDVTTAEPSGDVTTADPTDTTGNEPTPTGTTGNMPAPAETTTSQKIVTVTDEGGAVVTDEAGQAVTSVSVVTEAPAATTTSEVAVTVTDEAGQVVTDEAGQAVTSVSVVTEAPAATTTSQKIVTVTDEAGQVVTDEAGQAVTSISVVTNPQAPAATNAGRPTGGNATATGDATFVVIATMVAALGCALIVRKVNVR